MTSVPCHLPNQAGLQFTLKDCMSAAARFWATSPGEGIRRAGYPVTPTRRRQYSFRTGMPKRFASQAFGGNGRRVRGRFNGGGARRGRYAGRGRYRKVGYWGRFPGAGGPTHGGELKFHDVDYDQAAANWSAGVISKGASASLVLIGQGVTESTRIGRKCVIRSIGWRGKFNLVTSATIGAPFTVRIMLIQDTQCNGLTAAVATVSGVLATADYQSFNNLANKGRFKTLMDKTYTLNRMAAAGDGTTNDVAPVDRAFTFFKKCNIVMEYSGTAAPSVLTEVRTNNIFGIIISDSAGSNCSLDSKMRFRFSDG